MAEKPPFFKMDPAQFLQDSLVDAMTTAELGAAFRLLCRQWIDGSIPDNLDHLGRLCRLSKGAMESAWPILSQFFPEIEPGRRANRFMWMERETVLAAMKKRQDDGRDAVARRWEAKRKEKEGHRSPMPDLILHKEKDKEEEKDKEKESTPPPSAPDACQAVVDVWNLATAGKLVKARLTPKRQTAIRARLKDPSWEADFRKACEFLATSAFHQGDNARHWAATLDFLLQAGRATELAERFTTPNPSQGATHATRPTHHRAAVDADYQRQLAQRAARTPEPIDPAEEARLSELFASAGPTPGSD